MSMSASPSPALWSTVAALPDYLLLAQAAQLARHEQALQILVLDHLREIEARRLHLTRGYGSLFDYVVHELGYTAAAAWRRIKAMRLCDQTSGARELLQDGKLNLSNAAQLQNLFERSDRSRGRSPASQGTGDGLGGEQRNDGAAGEPAPSAPRHADGDEPAPGGMPVLDAAAREELVKRAAGKSTREVQQMVAEVDPELAQPSDRMRALGGGRWELKATIDAECRHGLEKLQMLLSHTDPHLTLGALVARLVRDGLDRYDPARPPRTRRSGGRHTAGGERSARTPAQRRTEVERNGAARAVAQDGGWPTASAPKRGTKTERGGAALATVPSNGGRTAAPAKHQSEAEPGRAACAVVRDGSERADSAAKRVTQDEGVRTGEAERLRGAGASAPGRWREAEDSCGQPKARRGSGGRGASLAKRQGRAGGDGRNAGVGGVLDRATCAAGPQCEVGEREAARAPVRGGRRWPNSAAKRLAYGAGYGAAGPAERSPTLERHLAALSCFGAWPGSRSRYIPAAVEAGGVAARPGTLQLCRPEQRAVLRLPLSAGD